MLEQGLDFERNAFLLLNGVHSLFGDQFFWLISGKTGWIPVCAVFIVILFYNLKNWKEALLIMLAIALAITLCDQFASGLCKPYFHRFRPSHHPDFMNDVQTVFGYRGGKYGFISSHAANAFGFATLTALIFRYKIYTYVIFLWAAVNAYSRIYLGVHFISDIVGGMLAGVILGWTVYRMYVLLHKRLINKKLDAEMLKNAYSSYMEKNLNIILYTFALTVTVMFFISILYSFKILSLPLRL